MAAVAAEHSTTGSPGPSRPGKETSRRRAVARRLRIDRRYMPVVVIGGTLLTGGTGFVLGSVLGVLVLGLIQTIITFEGTLSSWWTKIAIGALLLVFVVLQRVLTLRRT